MKLTKRQLKRIIREEKQNILRESYIGMLDIEDPDVSELLMNFLDGIQRSEVDEYYWGQMLKLMQKIGPDKTMMVIEKAVADLRNGVDPNTYA